MTGPADPVPNRNDEWAVSCLDSSKTDFQLIDETRARLSIAGDAVVLELDRIRRERDQLKGELLVRCELPGARTYDGVLAVCDLNLSSSQARRSQARYLAERSATEDLDWTGLLEELGQRVLAEERTGQPAVILGDLERPSQDKEVWVEGLALLRSLTNCFFGDGGTLKSMLALLFLGHLAHKGLRVGFFDWELEGEAQRERLERLFGENMPRVHYVRCVRPLVYEAERLRGVVRDLGLDFAVFDSVAFACDGPPEAAEVATRYIQAVRHIGPIGSLHLAHITKAKEGADQRPFGSTFWHNGFRSIWNVKLQEALPGDTSIAIALINRKANLGPKHPPVGLEFTFGDRRTEVRTINVGDVPDLAANLSIRQRMELALRNGPMDTRAVADQIDAKRESVRRTARRYPGQFETIKGGLIALAEVGR